MRTHRIPRRLARVAMAAALIVAAAPAQASLAQTLDGERFTSQEHVEAFTYAGQCNADGSSTFSFWALGPATGPVEGQFSESGTFTLASPNGPVTAFSSEYTIYTPDADVTGTRALSGPATGSCSVGQSGDAAFDATIPAQYTVSDPFAETGPSSVTLHGEFASGSFLATFGEPAPTGPTSKEDCKNGGYVAYGFKNQGECIKAVNHP